MDFIFYLSLLSFILVFGALDINIDYDFWARLTVGKSFFQTGHLFNHDFQSYGTTHEFIDHEWGSSLIFYLIQSNFGDVGLYVFKSLIIFLTLFIIVKIIRLEKHDIKLHFLFFFFAMQSITYNIFSTIRCQTFSFLFFVFYLYILKYAKIKNNYRILWVLPVLNIIWANLHGGFSIGLVLTALFALGEYLNKNTYKPYLYALMATCLTTLINPYGIKYVVFIYEALKLNRIHIIEWHSAFFTKVFYFSMLKFKIFFVVVFLIFIYSIFKNIKNTNFVEFYKKTDKAKYLILLFTFLISLKSLRFHVFFTYSVIALCYVDFYNIFNKKLNEKIDNVKEIILCILIVISAISHIYSYKFINVIRPSQYPIYCVEFIKLNKLKGNVFTNFHLGSYTAYKLYPQNQIFMDGRYEEVYDNNLINEMSYVFLAKDYKNILKKYHSDILVLDKSYPIYNIIKKDKEWFLAYEDKYFALVLPIKLKNKKFVQPSMNEDYYCKNKFKTDIDWIK